MIAVIYARRYGPLPLYMYPLLAGAEKGPDVVQTISKNSSEGQLAEQPARALDQLAMVSSSSGNKCSVLRDPWDNILYIRLHCLLLTSRS